jgi:glycosyltransferase involved in cell wall biosynthesis
MRPLNAYARDRPKPRFCIVTTSDLIVRFFLLDLLRALSKHYTLTLVVNTGDDALLSRHGIPAELVRLGIERAIAPLADAAALARLGRLFVRQRFDGVVSLAPKAGLLAMAAARFARIPFRCHVFQGEVWASARGVRRALLKSLDRFVATLATHLLVISASERSVLEREGIVQPGQAELIANGSLCGVDLDRFRADPQWRGDARSELGLPRGALVVLFLGRITRDKGVLDLAHAFRAVAGALPQAHLVYVGPDEQGLEPALRAAVGEHSARLRIRGLTDAPERYIAAADVLALPSYREGFGNVLIEAAAAGVPGLASRIYGIEDALRDGETGLLHPPGDVGAIAAGLRRLFEDAPLREKLGRQARERAAREFGRENTIAFWIGFLQANTVR